MRNSLVVKLALALASASMASAGIGSSLAGPEAGGGTGDHSDYIYYGADVNGGGRSMLRNDAVIGQAMGWGVKFTFQKFNDQVRTKYNLADPNSFRIPSVAEYDNKADFPQGTSVMLSCYDNDLFNTQHGLNQQCAKDPKCKHDYIVAALWGTIGSMDFRKDGILLNACVLLEIDTGNGCGFPNSPACHPRVVKDLTQETNAGSVSEGSIVTFGPVSSIPQVTSALKDWAAKNNQQVTLPDGSITGKK
ncbi:uncharacterized protein FA14DRAFT_152257 [Meira miltonrushii]|uniref:Uncharacterized protein n=1 Tax=Meira miltonrushii TaxID=1280837 RepID=A0A316VHV9_9BASI|nr:uncharacterized protein FA14DRAFT_152257 [Meira miltonrushii]PWN36834.1 hypothetical protein FA14DRAFT_152257 [Meira miltonrushii]